MNPEEKGKCWKNPYAGGKRIGCGPGAWRGFRFLEPYILLELKKRASYGYELMEALKRKIVHGVPDAGAVYRTLRFLEEKGFVTSTWETKAKGPIRRYYEITEDGKVLLDNWAENIEKCNQTLKQFLKDYRGFKDKNKKNQK